MNILLYGIPFFLTSALFLTYLINSEIYLTYVLNGLKREFQIVEIITFICALFSSFILWKNAIKIKNITKYKLSFFALIIIGLAAFFFAGEEISWGQTYLKWETPKTYVTKSVETNLHNSPIPINTFGNIFLISVFIILPLFYYNKKSQHILQSLSLSVPNGPSIFCIVYGILWRGVKVTYMLIYSKEVLKTSKLYMEFVEQINEQKEMLVAVGLLIYAININKRVSLIKE